MTATLTRLSPILVVRLALTVLVIISIASPVSVGTVSAHQNNTTATLTSTPRPCQNHRRLFEPTTTTDVSTATLCTTAEDYSRSPRTHRGAVLLGGRVSVSGESPNNRPCSIWGEDRRRLLQPCQRRRFVRFSFHLIAINIGEFLGERLQSTGWSIQDPC